MDVKKIIDKYYLKNNSARNVLLSHGKAVSRKALEIAEKNKHLNPDIQFIKEASLVHDMGMILTDSPEIFCYGDKEYILHGVLGAEILKKEGLEKHALVCERHIGVGITLRDIKENNLPLPKRDMIPISIEEEIICLADKFFSKKKNNFFTEKTISEVIKKIGGHGKEKEEKINFLLKKYSLV